MHRSIAKPSELDGQQQELHVVPQFKSNIFIPGPKRLDVRTIRINNERTVLTAIAVAPGIAAADVTRTTGLAAHTVNRIVSDLHERGLLLDGERRISGRGQPSTPLYVNPDGAYTIGCQLGFGDGRIFLRKLTGDTLRSVEFSFDSCETSAMLDSLVPLTTSLVEVLPQEMRAKVIGIGVAYPADFVAVCKHLGGRVAIGWDSRQFCNGLAERTGQQVWAFDFGAAACWAELAAQPHPRPSNFIHLHVGKVLASGLLAEGSLWEGPSGLSGNVGASWVRDLGGKGAFLFELASLWTLERFIEKAGKTIPPLPYEEWHWEQYASVVGDWIAEAANALAQAIANAAAVVEVRSVVLDGPLPDAILDRLVDALVPCLDNRPSIVSRPLTVTKGHLRRFGPSRGAALIPLYRSFYSPDPDHFQIQ